MKKIISLMLGIIIMLMPVNIEGVTGRTKTYNIQAEVGYRVIDVIVNGISKGVIESYTFTDLNGPQELKIITEKIQEVTSYTVTFDANGGTGTMAAQTFREGMAQNLTTNTFTRDEYTFAGWSTTTGGSVEYTDGASYIATENTTLYAIWTATPILAAQDTWYKGATAKNTITEINIVDSYTPTGNETESWDASDPSVPGTVTAYVEGTKLTIAGNGAGFIYANPDSTCAFSGSSEATQFKVVTAINGLNKLDTSKVTQMASMFSNCSSLTSLDVSRFNTSLVTNVARMFYQCGDLTSLDLESKVVTVNGKTYTAWDTSNFTYLGYTFSECSEITELKISNWNTSNVSSMLCTFLYCEKLPSLDISKKEVSLNGATYTAWDTGNVNDMRSTFSQCFSLTELDVSGFNTSKVTEMSQIFSACRALKLIDISNWDMSKVTSTYRMFNRCLALESLTIPASAFVISPEFAYNCRALTTITFLHGANDTLSMPDAGDSTSASAGDGGAFYVPNYVETTINAENDIAKNYDWVTDNRAKNTPEPIMQSWGRNDTTDFHANKSTVTSVTFLDTYNGSATMTAGPWDISEAKDSSVMAYQNGTNVYICSNVGEKANIIANQNSGYIFYGFSSMTAVNGADKLDTSQAIDLNGMFSGCSEMVTPPDTSNWDTSMVKEMNGVFYHCEKMASTPDTSNWDTSMVEDMSAMFYGCYAMTTAPNTSNWDTSMVKNMYAMFRNCYEMVTTPDTSNWDTSMVEDVSYMFSGCQAIVTPPDTSNWDTSMVEDMSYMFRLCDLMTTAPNTSNWDTSEVTDMTEMFRECLNMQTAPNTSNWDTSKVESMNAMFQCCEKMASTPDTGNWDTSMVTDMYAMFEQCFVMPTAPNTSNWNTSKVTDMSWMFLACKELTSLDLSSFDTSAITNTENLTHFAYGCDKLATINLGPNFGQSGMLPNAGNNDGMFYTSSRKTTTVINANSFMKNYAWSTDNRTVTHKTAL